MSFDWMASAADRRLLPEGRLAGPMPWVIAIMMFLMVLAAASGLGLATAASALSNNLVGKLTVQIVEANPDIRIRQAKAAEAMLQNITGVTNVNRISDAEMSTLLAPWLGSGGLMQEDIPVPVLIDVSMTSGSDAMLNRVKTALRDIAPAARIDRHARWLSPLSGLMTALKFLSAGLVLLMGAATAAVVVLAAHGALNTHRVTIDALHFMGANDGQISWLFQRRIALDALFGGMLGFIAAILVMLILGAKVQAIGSELLGAIALDWRSWALISILPFAGAVLAMIAARITIVRSLREML